MRDSITVHLAPGWQELSAADFAPAFADVAGDAVRYSAAIPPERVGYAANLVVVRVPVGPDQDPEQELMESARAMVESIPGMRLIEDVPTDFDLYMSRVRAGVYILDEDALTVLQVAWLDMETQGTSLWTATFTCRTRDFSTFLAQYYEMAQSLEVTE